MLSQHERRQLEAIEQWFEASDPEFCRMLTEPAPDSDRVPLPRWAVLRRVAVNMFGLLLILVGAITAELALVGTGIAVLVAGAVMHLQARTRPARPPWPPVQ